MQQIHHLCRQMICTLTACLLVVQAAAAVQQEPQTLTNQDVINLVLARTTDQRIVEIIRSSKPNFDLSDSGIVALKSGGVSQVVISEITAGQACYIPLNPAPTRPAGKPLEGVPDCKTAGRGVECAIRVDRTDLAAVGSYEVASGSKVHILVYRKSPFERVRFDSERKEVAPPPDPLAGIISLLSGAAGSINLASRSLAATSARSASAFIAATTDDQRRLFALLNTLIARKQKRVLEIMRVRDSQESLRSDLAAFFSRGTAYCPNAGLEMSSDFEQNRVRLIRDLCQKITQESPLSTQGEEEEFKAISKLLEKVSLDGSVPTASIDLAVDLMNQANGAIRLLQGAIANLDEARKQFTEIRNKLIDLEAAKCFQDIRVVADRQADIAGNLVFTNVITGKDDDKKLFTRVKYRDLPRASLSTGVLVSSLEKRKFAVVPVFDASGTNATDPVQSHKEIRGEVSKPQVIPFTFINIRLADWRIGQRLLTFNVAPAVGINPNNGTTETEFAFGASVGLGNAYFFGGAHLGRQPDLINGFSLGNRVPDTFVAPVGRSWKTGFGFGISYRLPLP